MQQNERIKTVILKPGKIGVVVRHDQPQADTLAVDVAHFIHSRGIAVVLSDESVSAVKLFKTNFGKRVRVMSKNKLVEAVDMIIVLGGDGTFLGVARLMGKHSIPIIGVNMGQLGFLTEIKKDEALTTLDRLLSGDPVRINERTLFEVTLKRKRKVIFSGPVVNDAVISKAAIARIIWLQVSVNGKWVHDVRADGIIVSTPTGSTAYSLAAGGPIIEPTLNALVMSPICPHSLTQRPVVIPDSSEVQIHLKEWTGDVLLTLDGQDAIEMQEGDTVTIKQFKKHRLKLISSPTRDYFSILREKLNFGMRN